MRAESWWGDFLSCRRVGTVVDADGDEEEEVEGDLRPSEQVVTLS